jgi:hypothetical protein
MDVINGAGQPAPDVLVEAARHVVAGRNVLALSPKTRKPTHGWKRWQTELQIDLPHPEDDAFLVEHVDREDVGLGLVTGAATGIVVMDFDDEAAWLAALERSKLPTTPMVFTGKGRHLYFAHPGGDRRNRAGLDGLRLDVRADGGLSVAPPTWHPGRERHYEWAESLSPWEIPFAPMPPELIAWCWPPVVHRERKPSPVKAGSRYAKAALEGEVLRVLTASKGTRNATLNEAAYSVFRLDDVDVVNASEALLSAALSVGLTEHESTRTIASALQARGRR